MAKRRFLPMAAAFAASLALVGMGALAPVAGAAHRASTKVLAAGAGGTLNIATQTDVPSLDPAIGVDSESAPFVQDIFAGLVQWAPTQTKLVPDLASRWTWNTAGTVVTFHLRKAVFSNGDPVTAQDVQFSFDRILNPKTSAFDTSALLGIVGAQAYNSGHAKSVPGIVVLNPTTVQLKLLKPEPYLMDYLAAGSASIMDPAVVSRYAKDVSDHPVGAGPFKLQSWVHGQQMVLVRNSRYWNGGLPKLSRIVLKIGLTASQQFEAFQQGKLDIIGDSLTGSSTLDPNTYLSVLNNQTLKKDLIKAPLYEVFGLWPNAEWAPFKNVDVRDAMLYAINRPHLIQIINGVGSVSNQLLPPGILAYNTRWGAIPLDDAKAKKLLQEGHYNPHTVVHLLTTNDPFSMAVCQAIQADLAKIGMKVVLQPEAVSTYLNTMANPKIDQLSFGFWETDIPDPEDFLYNMFSSQTYGLFNASYWSTPQVDALLSEADHSVNNALRIKDYTKIQQIVMQQGGEIPLFNGEQDELRQPSLGPSNPNYFANEVTGIQYAYIYKK